MKAIILVGGEGTRLRPLTYVTTKAMVPVLNRPFIEYLIRHLNDHDIRDIVLAIGYKPDTIRDHFDRHYRFETQLVFSIEDTPLGTAGAVRNAAHLLDEQPFFIINGDIFYDLDFTAMMDFHKQHKAKLTLSLTPVDDPTQFGVVEIDNHNRVDRFVEKPDRADVTGNLISAGVYILEPDVLERVPAGKHCMFEREVFPQLLSDKGPVYAYPTDSYWIDIGTPQKYLQLNHDLLTGKSSQVAFEHAHTRIGKDCSIHPETDLVGPMLVGDGCTISKGVQITGPTVIGERCTIAENVVIKQSVLWQNIRVGAHAVVDNCIIADDNTIDEKNRVAAAVIGKNGLTD